MLLQADLKSVLDEYEKATQEAILAARKIDLPSPAIIPFRTSTLDEAAVVNLLEKLPILGKGEKTTKKRGFLYIFRTTEQCAVARQDILSTMQSAKERQKGKKTRNLPAVNPAAVNGRTLYVGRSWTPGSRIRGHLEANLDSGTYALHFTAWAQGMDLDVELVIYDFPGIKDRTLQVLEDGLWDRFQPLFGRRGEK